MDVREADHLLAARGLVVGAVFPGSEAEEAGGHLVGGSALAADGEAGDGEVPAVIAAPEGIGGDGGLLAVDLAVEGPADGQPLTRQGNVGGLLEVLAAPVHVRVDGGGEVAELGFVRDAVGIGLGAGAAGEVAGIGRLIVGEVAVGGLVLGLGQSGVVGVAGLGAGEDLGLGDFVVHNGNFDNGGLGVVPAVPGAVLELLLGLDDRFAVGLDVGDGAVGVAEGDELGVLVIGPVLQGAVIQAEDGDVDGEGGEGLVEAGRDGGVALRVVAGHLVHEAAGVGVALVIDTGGDLGADGLHGVDGQGIVGVLAHDHGAVQIIPAGVALADAGDPAGDHAGVGGVLLGGDVAGGVAVHESAGVAGDEIADHGHALVAVRPAAGAVDIAVGPAVGDQAPVVEAHEAADFRKVARGDDAGGVHLGTAVEDGALILHADETADELVALGRGQGEGALDGAAVDDSAGVVIAKAVGDVAGDAAEVGGGLIAGVERHIGEVHVLDHGLGAQNAEEAHEGVPFFQSGRSLLRAEGHAGDGVALAIKGAVEGEVAAADGGPGGGGDVDVIAQGDKRVGVVDLVVRGGGEGPELGVVGDEVGGSFGAVTGGEDAGVDLAIDPEAAGQDHLAVGEGPILEGVVHPGGHGGEVAAAGDIGGLHVSRHGGDGGGSQVIVQELGKFLARNLVGRLLFNRFRIGLAVSRTKRGIADIIAAVRIGRCGKVTGNCAGPIGDGIRGSQRYIACGIDIVDDAVDLTKRAADIAVSGVGGRDAHITQSIVVHEEGLDADPGGETAHRGTASAGIRGDGHIRAAVGDGGALVREAGQAANNRDLILRTDIDAAGCRAVVDDGGSRAVRVHLDESHKSANVHSFCRITDVDADICEVDILDDHAVQRVAEQARIAQGVIGDGQAGDGVAVAIKRSAEGQRGGGADGGPLAGQSDVGGQLEVLTGIGGASRHLGLEVAQTRLAGDEVGIALRASAAGETGARLAQGVLGGCDDGFGADGGAADGVDLFVVQLLGQAVGAVVGLDGVQDFSQRSEVSFSPVAAMFEMTVFSPSLASVTVTVTSPLKPVAVPL